MINDYLKGFESVPGWSGYGALRLILAMEESLEALQADGDYLEIGVHCGRSAIILGLLANLRRRNLFVCDLFNNQQDNVSRSGSGDKEVFEDNYENWVGNKNNLIICETNSRNLGKILSGERFRLVHIDGGHTKEETLNDLEIASKHLSQRGLILVDDVFNHRFPGVSEGINYFLMSKKYLPIIIGKNKLVLCDERDYNSYFQHFSLGDGVHLRRLNQESEYIEKRKYFGAEVIIYGKTKNQKVVRKQG